MSLIRNKFGRVLSVYPNSKGFGFVVIETRKQLIDWGAKRVHQPKNKTCVKKVLWLIEAYAPDAIILPHPCDPRRSRRIRSLINGLVRRASRSEIELVLITRDQTLRCFARHGVTTKYEIAKLIADRYPALKPMLPKPRRPWQSEDYRMGMFGAACCFYASALND